MPSELTIFEVINQKGTNEYSVSVRIFRTMFCLFLVLAQELNDLISPYKYNFITPFRHKSGNGNVMTCLTMFFEQLSVGLDNRCSVNIYFSRPWSAVRFRVTVVRFVRRNG
jgi:hypothetical protein